MSYRGVHRKNPLVMETLVPVAVGIAVYEAATWGFEASNRDAAIIGGLALLGAAVHRARQGTASDAHLEAASNEHVSEPAPTADWEPVIPPLTTQPAETMQRSPYGVL